MGCRVSTSSSTSNTQPDELVIGTITSPGELTPRTACTCLESLQEAIDKVGELPAQGLHDAGRNIHATPRPCMAYLIIICSIKVSPSYIANILCHTTEVITSYVCWHYMSNAFRYLHACYAISVLSCIIIAVSYSCIILMHRRL